MRKKYFPFLAVIGLLLGLFSIPASAADICTVISFDDKTAESKCYSVPDDANGIESLQSMGVLLSLTPQSSFGRMVCKIDNKGTDVQGSVCGFDGKFWNFNLKRGASWGHMPVGFDGGNECWNRDFNFADFSKIVHYCAKDGDVIGMAFGKEGEVPDMLRVKEIKVTVDNELENETFAEGGVIDQDVEPGSEVSLRLVLENLYEDDTNAAINDIIVRANLEDIDQGDSIRLRFDEFTLGPGAKEAVEIDFTIPTVVEAKGYDLSIKISAKDDLGFVYDKNIPMVIDVQKESHKMKIPAAKLDKTAYTCEENALLDVQVVNIGAKPLVGEVSIDSGPLELSAKAPFSLSNDALESTSRFEKQFTIALPQELNPDSYQITIRADAKTTAATEIAKLIKQACTEQAKLQISEQKPAVRQAKGPAGNSASSGEQSSQPPAADQQPQNKANASQGNSAMAFLFAALGISLLMLGGAAFAVWKLKMAGKR